MVRIGFILFLWSAVHLAAATANISTHGGVTFCVLTSDNRFCDVPLYFRRDFRIFAMDVEVPFPGCPGGNRVWPTIWGRLPPGNYIFDYTPIDGPVQEFPFTVTPEQAKEKTIQNVQITDDGHFQFDIAGPPKFGFYISSKGFHGGPTTQFFKFNDWGGYRFKLPLDQTRYFWVRYGDLLPDTSFPP